MVCYLSLASGENDPMHHRHLTYRQAAISILASDGGFRACPGMCQQQPPLQDHATSLSATFNFQLIEHLTVKLTHQDPSLDRTAMKSVHSPALLVAQYPLNCSLSMLTCL